MNAAFHLDELETGVQPTRMRCQVMCFALTWPLINFYKARGVSYANVSNTSLSIIQHHSQVVHHSWVPSRSRRLWKPCLSWLRLLSACCNPLCENISYVNLDTRYIKEYREDRAACFRMSAGRLQSWRLEPRSSELTVKHPNYILHCEERKWYAAGQSFSVKFML